MGRLLPLLLILAVFAAACVEMRPREGLPDKATMIIETGSDSCIGYNSSTCGAFVKEMRSTLKDYVCTGYDGPIETANTRCIPCPNGVCNGATCMVDTDCGANSVCNIDKKCVPSIGCGSDSNCPFGSICANNVCIINEQCEITSDCAEGYICSKGRCTADKQCITGSDCIEGSVCVGGTCIGRTPVKCTSSSGCILGSSCYAEELFGGAQVYDLRLSDGWTCFPEAYTITKTAPAMSTGSLGISNTHPPQLSFLTPSYGLSSISFGCSFQASISTDCPYYIFLALLGSDNFQYSGSANLCGSRSMSTGRGFTLSSSAMAIPDDVGSLKNAIAKFNWNIYNTCNCRTCGSCFAGSSPNGVALAQPETPSEEYGRGLLAPLESGAAFSGYESSSLSSRSRGRSLDLMKCCHGSNIGGPSGSYSVSCTPTAYYPAEWKCINTARSGLGQTTFRFLNCSEGETKTTFQGGTAQLESGIHYTELSSFVSAYYAGQSNASKQVPFFMIGQGPSFSDYEEAKKRCTPFTETFVNISLGDTTFDPPSVILAPRSELCLENFDREQSHKVDLTVTSTGRVSKGFELQPSNRMCYTPASGEYVLNDSNGDYADVTISAESTASQFYIGRTVVPDYGVATVNGVVNFSLTDRNNHSVNATFLASGNPFVLDLDHKNYIAVPGAIGEYSIKDNSTNSTSYVFVQSADYMFTFKGDGTVLPQDRFIARPLGDPICFTSNSEGLTINISRETENGFEDIDTNKPVSVSPAYCCVIGSLPGNYTAVTSDGRNVSWLIGSRKPTATIRVQAIGFDPEKVDTPPGSRVCWINPTIKTRDIITNLSQAGRIFASAKVPGLSDDTCYPQMESLGSYLTYFLDPPVNPRQIVNVKNSQTRNINILAYGFDPQTIAAQPGDSACWINTDTKRHTLTSETGAVTVLEAKQTDCLASLPDGAYFSRSLDNTSITSVVTSVSGDGAIVTPFGVSPTSVIMTRSNSTYTQTLTIINALPRSASLVTQSSATLTSNQTYPSNISAISRVDILISNTDSDSHELEIYDGSVKRGNVNVSGNGFVNVSFIQFGRIVDKTALARQLGGLTCQTDAQCRACSGATNTCGGIGTMVCASDPDCSTSICQAGKCSYNTTALLATQLSAEASSTILVNIQPAQFQSIPPNGRVSAAAPMEIGNVQLFENSTNSTISISFIDPLPSEPTSPIVNTTMDLPTQKVSGPMSSDMLAKMREYASGGAVPAVIPSFKNITVEISTSAFSPKTINISAGSNITWKNTDNVAHILTITKNIKAVGCGIRDVADAGIVSCTFNPTTQRCDAKLIDSERACQSAYIQSSCTAKPEFATDFVCALNLTNGKCVFKASAIGDACKGGCVAKEAAVSSSGIICGGVDANGGCMFGGTQYLYTAIENLFCKVDVMGPNRCTQSGPYSAVGCMPGVPDDGNCYAVPTYSATNFSMLASSRYCSVTQQPVGTSVNARQIIAVNYACSGVTPPNCPADYPYTYTRLTKPFGQVTGCDHYTKYCTKLVPLPCRNDLTCSVSGGMESCSPSFSCSPPSGFTGCSQSYFSTCPAASCTNVGNDGATSTAPATCRIAPLTGCVTQASGWGGYYCSNKVALGYNACYFGGMVDYSTGSPGQDYTSRASTPITCDPSRPADCPCAVCQKKSAYSAFSNIDCQYTGNDCMTVSSFVEDDGTLGGPFCDNTQPIVTTSSCDVMPGYSDFRYSGKAECTVSAGVCSLTRSEPMEDALQTFCKLSSTSSTGTITVTLCAKGASGCNPGDESFSILNVSGDTQFSVVDVLSGAMGSVESVYLSKNVSVGFSEIDPVVAEAAPGAQVKFNNYDQSLPYPVSVSFKPTNGATVTSSFTVPAAVSSFGVAGTATWSTPNEGIALFSVGSGASFLGVSAVNVSSAPETFDVTLDDSGFSVPSMAIDTNSKVCFDTDEMRRIRFSLAEDVTPVMETTLIPSTRNVDPNIACSRTFNCVPPPGMEGKVGCSGTVTETNDNCQYTILDPGLGCKQEVTSSCTSKNPDMICASDGSRDADTLMPGVQPVCLFEAINGLNTGACKGGCVAKESTVTSTGITCGGVDPATNSCTFGGSASTSLSNLFCTVGVLGPNRCTQAGPYKAIGCLPGLPDDGQCYTDPPAASAASSIGIFASDSHCDVTLASSGTVAGLEIISIAYSPTCGSCRSSPPACPSGYYTYYDGPRSVYGFEFGCRCSYQKQCARLVSLPCSSTASCQTTTYLGSTLYYVYGGMTFCSPSVSCTAPSPFTNCYQQPLSACAVTSCTDRAGSGSTAIATETCHPAPYNACIRVTGTSYTTTDTCVQRQTLGYNACYYGGSVDYSTNPSGIDRSYRGTNLHACDPNKPADCPCLACQKKSAYSALTNIACTKAGTDCITTSNFVDDDGTYCDRTFSSTCVADPKYKGTTCGSLPDTSCSLSSVPVSDTGNSVCALSGGSCSSKLTGVTCTLNSTANACDATVTGEKFCFTPQEGKYIVEDLTTGKGMTLTGYDKRTQLDINLKNSFILPSVITTSPGSDVCFRSADGKPHALSMPAGVNEGNDVVVPSAGLRCMRFPNGLDAWTIRLKERMTTSAAVFSRTTDTEIKVRYQVFDPDSVIVRPGSQITFINKDATSHTLLKGVTESALSTYTLNDMSQAVSGTFSTGVVSAGVDKSSCASDADCSAGSFCTTDGLCRPLRSCTFSEDCPSGFACYGGNCTLSRNCSTESDCPAGFACSAGICAASSIWCASDSDCAVHYNSSDYNCTSNRCTLKNLTCAAEVICPSNYQCIALDCIPGSSPACATDLNCAPTQSCSFGRCIWTSKSCSVDSDCGQGYACSSGTCALNCSASAAWRCLNASSNCTVDANCSAGQSCFNGFCRLASTNCAQAVPCQNGYGCTANRCALNTACASDSDCADGYSCVSGACKLGFTKPCVSDSSCPSGFYCSTDAKCVELRSCPDLATCLQANTSSSCFLNRCKLGIACGSAEDCLPGQSCTTGVCSVPFANTCGGSAYGSTVRLSNSSFTVPISTQRVTLVYEFNDNGKVDINGYEIAPLTKMRCITSDIFTQAKSVVPIGYLNLGGPNSVNATTCSCSGGIGAKLTIVYEYLPAFLSFGTDPPIVVPPLGTAATTLTKKEDFSYIDQKLLKSMSVSVKDCDGSDLSSIAERIGQYERPDYRSSACDTGDQDDCASYNPYGPSTISVLTTEEGLDLNNATERACALAQLSIITSACPQCTSGLYVGGMNTSDIGSLLHDMREGEPALFNGLDVIARSGLVNDYASCDIDAYMDDLVNSSKKTLYDYNKPSIVLDFGIRDGNNSANNCTWTNESIVAAYNDIFGIWIPILAGSGTVGLSQHCYTDPCPQNDNYGLLTSRSAEKPYAAAWFREGCGRYYYNAEGLALTTFSMNDTNYSLCDPSRILAVLQSAECSIGKKTLKTKVE
ncbi:Cupredoxin-like domain protein [uncultured archaeon]|nr:Cupredoxin-like domain protein [uncultured archaeon]